MHGVAERVQYPVTVQLGTGLLVYIANSCDHVIYDDIFRDQEYAAALDYVVAHVNTRPAKIIDLGMNMGYFTLYCVGRLAAAGTSGQFWGVEAVPEIARECDRRLRYRPSLIQRAQEIHILSGVVGKRTGSVGVEISLSHPCNRIVNGARPMAPDTTQVRLLKYIDLLSLDLPEHIDLLKCDIEGAEEQFCESYPELLKRCDAVVMEMHPELGINAAYCRAFLSDAGLTDSSVLKSHTDGKTLELFTRPAC